MPSSQPRSVSGSQPGTPGTSDDNLGILSMVGVDVGVDIDGDVGVGMGVDMGEVGMGLQASGGGTSGQSQGNEVGERHDAECAGEMVSNGVTGEDETEVGNGMMDISDLCPGSPSGHVDLATAGLLATSAEGDGSILGNDDTCHSTQVLQSDYTPLTPSLPQNPLPPLANPSDSQISPQQNLMQLIRQPSQMSHHQLPHHQPPHQQQTQIQQQLLHQPTLSAEWTTEDQRLLEEGLNSYPSENFTSLIRYLRVAATIPSKTARDVALRVRWMAKRDINKKRKAEQENLAKKNGKDKKDKVEVSKPPLTIATGRPLMATNISNQPGLSSNDMEDDGSPLSSEVEGTTGQLLEQNDQAIQQVRQNLNNCKLQNTDLLAKVRDNILAILKGLKSVPGIMKEMPPLPVKLNLELANTFLPRSLHQPPPST